MELLRPKEPEQKEFVEVAVGTDDIEESKDADDRSESGASWPVRSF